MKHPVGLRPDSVSAPTTNSSRAVIAANELRAHGHHAAAAGVAGKGIQWLKGALARNPQDADLLDALADAHAANEDWAGLLETARQEESLGQAPYSGFGVISQALAYARLGRAAEAREALRRQKACCVLTERGLAEFLAIPVLVALGDTAAAMAEARTSWNIGYWQIRAHHTRHRSVGPLLKDYPAFVELTRPRD